MWFYVFAHQHVKSCFQFHFVCMLNGHCVMLSVVWPTSEFVCFCVCDCVCTRVGDFYLEAWEDVSA